MENFKSLASRWDSNQVLKKPTGTTHPSLTKLPQCHAAQTSGNDQNKVDSSEFSIVTLNVSSGERHKKRDPCAQEIKISWDFSVCLVIWKLSDEHGRLISGRRKSWSAVSYFHKCKQLNNDCAQNADNNIGLIFCSSFIILEYFEIHFKTNKAKSKHKS